MEIGSDSTKWEKCARSRFTYLTVEGLRPERSYQFRISAENKHGVSDPCDPTVPITIPASRTKKRGQNEGYAVTKSATSTSWVSIVRRAESGSNISVNNRSSSYFSSNLMSSSIYGNLENSNSSFSRFLSPNVDYGRSRRSVSPSPTYRNLSPSKRLYH